jgi:hypothetical protein
MNANELRIGNLINCNGKEIILTLELMQLESQGHIVKFKPIPLTEEWLLRFGFEKSRLGYFTIFCGSNVMSVYCFEDFSRVQIVTQTVSTINHVHQLQNIYFALTGEELTLKTEL